MRCARSLIPRTSPGPSSVTGSRASFSPPGAVSGTVVILFFSRFQRYAAPKPLCSLLATLAALAPGRLPRDDRRVHIVSHGLLGDHHFGDIVPARDVVHRRLENFLHDRAQTSGAGSPQDGLVGDRLESRFGELKLYVVHLEELLVL